MVDRRFHVDRAACRRGSAIAWNCVSARSAARSLPSANERMPSASQYEASTGIAFAHVLGRGAVHHRADARLELPGALARRDRRTSCRRAAPCRLERRQRAQRRVHEQQPEDLSRERAAAPGASCRRRASASRSATWSRVKSARSRKRFMVQCRVGSGGWLRPAARRARRAAARRAAPRARRAAAGAGRAGRRWCRSGCRARAVALHLLRRPAGAQARAGTRRPGRRSTGPTTQVSRMYAATRAHVREQAFGLDDVDHRLDHRAGHRAAAERRAEVVHLQVRRDVVGHQQRRARESRRRAPWPS